MSPIWTGRCLYIQDMSHGTSRLMEFHASLHSTSCGTPRLVLHHISRNEDFHRKFLNFTREYLRVTMRGLPGVSEVTLELYCTNEAIIEQHLN